MTELEKDSEIWQKSTLLNCNINPSAVYCDSCCADDVITAEIGGQEICLDCLKMGVHRIRYSEPYLLKLKKETGNE